MSLSKAKDRHQAAGSNARDGIGSDALLMCAAHGCPNRWSTLIGHLCRWHADADPSRWPEVTQQQQWGETERARLQAEPTAQHVPLTFADKRAILRKLAALPRRWAARDPKEWAQRLRAREEAGERLSVVQREAWRSALQVGLSSASAAAITPSQPALASASASIEEELWNARGSEEDYFA